MVEDEIHELKVVLAENQNVEEKVGCLYDMPCESLINYHITAENCLGCPYLEEFVEEYKRVKEDSL